MMTSLRNIFAATLLLFGVSVAAYAQCPVNANGTNAQPCAGQVFNAINYNYGGQPASLVPGGQAGGGALLVENGNSATGVGTITVRVNANFTTPGGDTYMPLSITAPILVGSGTNQETVTPTGVSCTTPQVPFSCTITGTFNNLHGSGDRISSASFGLQEAINRAWQSGGGIVWVDQSWTNAGGTNATLTAALPYQGVTIEDHRSGFQTWTPTQAVATLLAAPTTLTSTTVGFGINGANTTGGAYTGASTYHYCIAYVDVMGNEGPCSADFSAATAGTGSTNQIGFKAPAASTGAVGYTVYISLAAGTYNLTYQAPLTSTTCTLTKVETVTPACAVTNTTYGQTGSNAIISALTVNTAPLHLLATTTSSTAAYIGTPSGRTSYLYAPHGYSAAAEANFTSIQQAYTIATAEASTVPQVVATIPVPIGALNFPGTTIRICGTANAASGAYTGTVWKIQFLWDAAGSNTTGAPVIVGNIALTATDAATAQVTIPFCETMTTTVSGATVTSGSMFPINGTLTLTTGAAGSPLGAGTDGTLAAVGSLNLAGTGGNTQRIHVVYLHTTGTDPAGFTVDGLTVELL